MNRWKSQATKVVSVHMLEKVIWQCRLLNVFFVTIHNAVYLQNSVHKIIPAVKHMIANKGEKVTTTHS